MQVSLTSCLFREPRPTFGAISDRGFGGVACLALIESRLSENPRLGGAGQGLWHRASKELRRDIERDSSFLN